jgi:hypothetical protein
MMGSDSAPSVLAVCRIEGAQSDLHYYNTAFSGGAGVSQTVLFIYSLLTILMCARTVAFLGSLRKNARQI